tara:strand:+ start:676 stop:963 length:288 start_codon:yes stop_codon:yes gene_type:complete
MRYNGLKIYKDSKGKRVTRSLVMSKPVHRDGDRFVEASTFDRLDNLAYQYYGNRDLWYVIALANNIGKGSLFVPRGMILRLPANPNETIESTTGY